jgi:hypothetical protein
MVLLGGACSEPQGSSVTSTAATAGNAAAETLTMVANAQPATAGRGLPKNAIHVEPAVILDAVGFERPMAAATLFLPYGWRAQGGVFWGQEAMCTNGYVFNWRATSPDGAFTIAVLPQERWEMNNYGAPVSTPGCRSAPYTNVRQYLEGLVQRLRPGAQLLNYRSREDLQREFAQLNSYVPTAVGEMRTWVEAGQALFAFMDQGRDMRGTIAAIAVFNLIRSNVGTGQMDALTGSTFPAYAASAPNGWLNEAFFEGIRRSIRLNPQWEQRINGHNAAIGRVALEESRKRSEIITRSNAEIAQIRQEAWNAYQQSSDRRFQEFGEAIRGVQTYSDANTATGQVELSNLYNHAWRLNDGSYVMTNDASFDPWRDLRVAGQRLELAPR